MDRDLINTHYIIYTTNEYVNCYSRIGKLRNINMPNK